MTHPRELRADPNDYKINRRLFRRIWRVAKPYWARKAAWPSWIVLGTLLLLAPLSSLIGAINSKVVADLTNVVVAKEAERYVPLLIGFLVLTAALGFVDIGMQFLDSRLDVHWRKWLTTRLIDRYLGKRTYYDIALRENLDNPDERIQAEVAPFVAIVSNFPRQVISSVSNMVMGAAILASIAPRLTAVIVLYVIALTVTMIWLYTPTIKQNFQSTVAEADLRYGVLHVRDNAETIAFYRGEYAERQQIVERLKIAIQRRLVVLNYQAKISSVGQVFAVGWAALPYLLLVPIYFAGDIQYGAIAQGTYAATTILSALSIFINFIPQVSAAAPNAIRVAEIVERFDTMDAELADSRVPHFAIHTGDRIRLHGVSLYTPGAEQVLVRNLSLEVTNEKHLVILGQTGVGKSSLLRAMAGLWTRGTGSIVMPPMERSLFLPQRPYMILADLRSQLLYPRGGASHSDATLQSVLMRVGLPDLISKHGGFDAVRDWDKVLSLGEQQRIAFARILISAPDFVFLDEATSAVDLETERLLYESLASSGATYVSVGHRPSLLEYHVCALRLLTGGAWEFEESPVLNKGARVSGPVP
jgi:putative ATP-binding cassette transporter